MNKKIKSLIIGGILLLVLVGALLLLLFLPKGEDNSGSSSESSAVSTTAVKVYEGSTDDVRSIQVEGPKGDYTIRREGEDYTIDELEGLEQLTNAYSGIAGQFASVTATRLIEENPSDIAKYGLKDPQAIVTVAYADQSKHEVRIGNVLPTSEGYYAQVDSSDTVYALGKSKYDTIDKRMLDFVSTQVIEPWTAPTDEDGNVTKEAPTIDYLEIEDGPFADIGVFRIEPVVTAGEDGQYYASGYKIVSPFEADFRYRGDSEGADQNAVYTERLADFSAEHVAAIHPSGEEDYGFEEPFMIIRFSRDGQGHTWTFGGEAKTIGGAAGHYLMADDTPVVYVVADVNNPWLSMEINNLFSSLVLLPNVNDIEGIDISVGGKSYTIKASGIDSELQATINGTELDTSIYRKFYQYLLSAPAEEYNRGSDRGELQASITYHYADHSKPDDVVRFYDAGNRRSILSLNGQETFLCRSTYVDYLARNCEKVLAGENPVLDY